MLIGCFSFTLQTKNAIITSQRLCFTQYNEHYVNVTLRRHTQAGHDVHIYDWIIFSSRIHWFAVKCMSWTKLTHQFTDELELVTVTARVSIPLAVNIHSRTRFPELWLALFPVWKRRGTATVRPRPLPATRLTLVVSLVLIASAGGARVV